MTFLRAALPGIVFIVTAAGSYWVLTRLSRFILWAQTFDGCRTCHLLGYFTRGPAYMLLRMHLRHISRAMDRDGEPVP